MKMNKTQRRQRIQKRYRDTVLGTADMPRMSIFRSNKEIYAQIVKSILNFILKMNYTEKLIWKFMNH